MTGGISMSSNTIKPRKEKELLETLEKVKRSLRTLGIELHFPVSQGGRKGYPGDSRRVVQRW